MPPTAPNDTPPNLDFILQTGQPKPRRFRLGNTKTQRIIIVGILGVVLIVVALILVSVMQNRSRRGSAELIDLAAYQTELVRVLDIGVKNSPTTGVQGAAETGRLTIISELIKTKKMISSKNVNLADSDLAKYQTTSIDTALNTAKTSNNFDVEFSKLIDEKYGDYKKKLANVFAAQNDTKIKNTLRVFNTHAGLLPFSYSVTKL